MSVREDHLELINRCIQCGTCTASCCSTDVSDFHIRKIVRRLQLGLETDEKFLKEIPWLCTQCGRCQTLCSEALALPDLIMALREVAIEKGLTPEAAGALTDSIKEGSPYVSSTRTKSSWRGDDVKINPDSDTLYWAGCTPSIMSQNIAKAAAKVLEKIGGGFRLLENEPCCAEPLIALGLYDDAKEVALKTIEEIKASGVKKVVTSCSGCFHTFTNSYPNKLGVSLDGIEVIHISQLLQNIEGKQLKLPEPMKITYHDPCSLGRENDVYDAPRDLLKSIEGVELIEMDPTRENTMCCGGGGGMWPLNRSLAMEIASHKLEKSMPPDDVDALVTCCPMCYNNFRYTFKKMKSPVKVYELSEVVAMGLEG